MEMEDEDSSHSSPEQPNPPKSKKRPGLSDILKPLIDSSVLGDDLRQLIRGFIDDPQSNENPLLLAFAPAIDGILQLCVDETTWEEHKPVLQAIAATVKKIVSRPTTTDDVLRVVVDVVKRLEDSLKWAYVDPQFKTLVSTIAVQLIKKTNVSSYLSVAMPLLDYLLDVALKERSTLVSELSKLKHMKSFVQTLNFNNPALYPLKKRLHEAMVCPNALKPHTGALVLAAFLSRSVEIVEEAQLKIKDNLRVMPKNQAQVYGHVYFNAWSIAEKPEVRKAIEIKCIQDLIQHFFTLKRGTLTLGKMGDKVLSILHQLHLLRRHRKFSLVITELYMPFIFRHLKSSNEAIRCNATQVLFDVFPLEMPGKGAVANSELYALQVKEIKDLLVDECHYVRILALRGISQVLPSKTQLFQKQEIEEILNIICSQLAFDGSSPQVRAAVFDGFSEMVAYEEARRFILPIVSRMRNHLHDESEIVRVSFVRLLIQIKSLDIGIWDVADLKHVIYRLEVEKEVVGSLMAQLIMPVVYEKGQAMFSTFSKIIRLIKVNGGAAIQLFQYSSSALDSSEAFEVVVSILGMLCSKVLELENNANKNNASPENESNDNRSPHRKRTKRTPFRDVANGPEENSDVVNSSTTTNSSCSSSGTEAEATEGDDVMSDHNTVDVLFKISAILWYKHLDQFITQGDKLDRLYTLCCTMVPFCQRTYAGKRVYYTIICFSSLIPINKLQNVSTTGSLCISHLKKMTPDKTYELKCLVYALSSWNRGTDVMELITESLNEAFRQINLNSSHSTRRAGRVRFGPANTCLPSVAVKLFEIIFSNRAVAVKELEKNYAAICDTHRYLSRIKTVVENRLSHGEPFAEPTMDDEFLTQCFHMYMNSIFILHRPGGIPPTEGDYSSVAFNAGNAYTEVITWAKEVLLPCLPAESAPPEEPTISVQLIKILLAWLKTSIKVGCSDNSHCATYSEFCLSLLTSGCPLFWIEEIFSLIAELSSFANAYDSLDQAGLFRLHIVRLIQVGLESLATVEVTAKNLCYFVSNVSKFKYNFFVGFTTITRRFGPSSDVFEQVFKTYMVTCVFVLAKEIAGECDEDSVADIRTQPYLVTFILKFLTQNKTLNVHILSTLERLLDRFKDESFNFLSCIKLLAIVVFSGRLNDADDDIKRCFNKAEMLVNERRLTRSNGGDNSRLNESSFSGGASLDILAVADKMLADVKDFLMVAR